MNHEPRPRTGFGRIELVICLGIAITGLAMVLPIANTVGCRSARLQSQQNLHLQHMIHELYAADWNQRQFTAVPDDLGVYGGDCAAWEAANGRTIPGLELGTDCSGERVGFFDCASAPVRSPIDLDFIDAPYRLPIKGSYTTAGAYRFPNCAALNQYASGRYHDPIFWAPDDVWNMRYAKPYLDGDCSYDAPPHRPLATSSYIMSPAAMFDPLVMGTDDADEGNYYWNDPNSFADGYRSPSVTACEHPALKTRMIEHHIVETVLPATIWNGFSQNLPAGNRRAPVPCLFNQSLHGRPLALFFDGSVRIHTMQEAMQSDDRVRKTSDSYWEGLTTRVNGQDYFTDRLMGAGFPGSQQDGSNHHVFTRKGIKGRDTLSTGQ